MKKILFKIIARTILITSGIFLMLFFLEIGLIIANYQKKELPWSWAVGKLKGQDSPRFFELSPQRIYVINKNINNSENYYSPFWASDKFGFRYNPSHKDNIYYDKTIIMVGDSFTYGHGVTNEETYPALMEKQLQSDGKNLIVHNAGVPGYGIDQEFLYITDDLIPNHHPDVIVWNIGPNDIVGSNELCLFKEKNNTFKQISPWYTSLYIQGLILKNTPPLFRDTNLLNTLVSLPQNITKKKHYTIGCTVASNDNQKIVEQFSKKLRFFLNGLEKISQEENIKILITVTPFQTYFNEAIQNNKVDFFYYHKLTELISSTDFKFVDGNQAVAQMLKPSLPGHRDNNLNIASSNENISRVLGVSTDLSESLFLNDKGRHLNRLGHQWFAKVVSNKLQYFLSD